MVEKFNNQSFKLWKLKMEYIIVDRDQWVVVFENEPMGMEKKDWENWIGRRRVQFSCAFQI